MHQNKVWYAFLSLMFFLILAYTTKLGWSYLHGGVISFKEIIYCFVLWGLGIYFIFLGYYVGNRTK